MRFGRNFGPRGEGHSNSTHGGEECGGRGRREKLEADPWESREEEEEEEFSAF